MSFNKIDTSTEKFEFFEGKASVLQSTEVFVIGTIYEAIFKVKNIFAIPRKLRLLNDQFQFKNNGSEIEIPGKQEKTFGIVFSPRQEGKINFLLLLEKKAQESEIYLLSRNLTVIKATAEIDAVINEPLPKNMKLAQKKEIIFLFTNKSNRAVTGVTIEIEQVEVG